jgi:hypothetical protein
MKNPLNVNGKIIDAANVTTVKPLAEDRLSNIDTTRNFTAEIRLIDRHGVFVEEASVQDVADALDQVGEKLTLLRSGEAVRADWINSIKPFVTTDPQIRFRSVIQFRHPETGLTAEEWFTARVEDIPGGNAPRLADLLAELTKHKTPEAKPKEPPRKAQPAAKLDDLTPNK